MIGNRVRTLEKNVESRMRTEEEEKIERAHKSNGLGKTCQDNKE